MNNTTITNAASTDVSLADIHKVMAEAMNKMASLPHPPDVYVMTTAAFNVLRKHTQESRPDFTLGQLPLSLAWGIPIEHYATKNECLSRKVELHVEFQLDVCVIFD